jgi:hypothetical protein
MTAAIKERNTSNMRRIRKGDMFFDGEQLVEAMGFAQKLDDGKVRVPVWVSSSSRPSRRTYDGDRRVTLL